MKIARSFLGPNPITKFSKVLSPTILHDLKNVNRGIVEADQLSIRYFPQKNFVFDEISSKFIDHNYVIKKIVLRWLEAGSYIIYNMKNSETKNYQLQIPLGKMETVLFCNETRSEKMEEGDMLFYPKQNCVMINTDEDMELFFIDYEEKDISLPLAEAEEIDDMEENIMVAMPSNP